MSNLVDSWLNGIGLGYAVPIFAGQGIDSPDMLSDLDVVDFPELGITDQNDRKKLFYLIQRVKLALARGRAAETKAAPQADSSVSSGPAEPAAPAVAGAPRIATGRSERERTKAPNAAELGSPRAAHASTRFRRAPEAPAARGPGSPRAGTGFGRVTTPARAQRLPPSHRRPKTPHADGSVRGGHHHHHHQPQQSSASTRMASPRGSRTRHDDQQEPVDRVAVAAAETGVADSAFEHEAATQALPQEQHQGISGKRATKNSSARPRRSVLEPVQLDEAGGRASVSSSSSSVAALTTRSAPPPPPAQRCRPPPRDNTSQAAGLVSGSEATTEEGEEQQLRSSNSHPVAVVRTVPAQPLRSGRKVDLGSSAAEALARRRSPEGRRRAPPPSDGAPPPAAAAVAARSLPDPEVARLYSAGRGTAASTDAAVYAGSRTVEEETAAPATSDVSSCHGNGSAEAFPGGGSMNERRRRAPPLSSTPSSSSSSSLLPRGDAESAKQEPAEDGPARAAGRGRRRSAAELAVHLISAHREDVKSALAAARRDMDLVSMADQDRKPAALMEYAREVESVLGRRLEAGARLRQALDDYVALRQAAARGAVCYEEGELRRGRLQGGGRAVEA